MEKVNVKALPSVGFVEATKRGGMNLFNFKSRTRRSEFWWFFPFMVSRRVNHSVVDFCPNNNRSMCSVS